VSTDTATRASHRRLVNPSTGNHLRITRWAEGARRRSVFRALDNGDLVELGSAVLVGGRLVMVYPADPALEAFSTDSFIEAARMLDLALEVGTLSIYTVKVRTTTLPLPDPRRIDADDMDTED
jgi:hypothetical protein